MPVVKSGGRRGRKGQVITEVSDSFSRNRNRRPLAERVEDLPPKKTEE